MSRISPSDISYEVPRRVSRERNVISETRCLSLSPPLLPSKSGLGTEMMQKAGETPPFLRTPPCHLCSQAIMCVRARASEMMYIGAVPLFLESRARARFFRLFSPSPPSSRSLRPCGLGRLRVCYLAATPLSNLQHRDARMQHTRLPLQSVRAELRLENHPPAVKRVSGMVSAFSRFRCLSP